MFYLVGIFRISSLGESISNNPEGTALRRQGEEPDYIKVLQQRAGSLSIKRLLLIKKKKNRYPKLRNLGLFYVWEDSRVWAH